MTASRKGIGGRPAKPIAQKKLEGTYKACRAVGAIDKKFAAISRMPKPPEELNEKAVETWYDVGNQLINAEIFKALDLISFALFCAEVARWREAEMHIKEDGIMFSTPKGRLLRPNPWLSISSNAFDKIRRFFSEFGLTPAERARIKITDEKEPDTLADKLFELTNEVEKSTKTKVNA